VPKKILGIYRLPLFSNNAIEADRAILETSMSEIERSLSLSTKITMIEESALPSLKDKDFDLVLTMAQSQEALVYQESNLSDLTIWNSPQAIRNSYRKAMSQALIDLDVNYVPFQVVPTKGSIPLQLEPHTGYWLKRSDFHAISDEDVALAENAQEAQEKLKLFSQRGVSEVIVQRHIQGLIYKFYGVMDKFFEPIRLKTPTQWQETANVSELERIATISARELGLQVYGGDAILDDRGNFHLIDLNDWPSFRLCREKASKAIASLAKDYLESASTSKETSCQPHAHHQ